MRTPSHDRKLFILHILFYPLQSKLGGSLSFCFPVHFPILGRDRKGKTMDIFKLTCTFPDNS